MKVSVIIPCYSLDRLEDIREAVWSVQVQILKPIEIIIAVDHNEELLDKLTPILKDGVRVVLNEGIKGSAETRNFGIREASGDIVAFIDDDAVAEKDWLEKLVQHYEEPNIIAVGGKIISVWDEGRPSWFPEELDWIVGGTYKGFAEAQVEVRNLLWPNMSFRRDVCDEIGYVRTDMGALGGQARAGDETEFCMRIRKYIPNARIVYEPGAVVYHRANWANQTTLRHLIGRSYSDGMCKGKALGVFKGLSEKAFSTETSYLRFLLTKSIPEKLGKGNLTQVGVIVLSIFTFGLGYLRGRLTHSPASPNLVWRGVEDSQYYERH